MDSDSGSSMIDPATGLMSRRAFYEVLDRRIHGEPAARLTWLVLLSLRNHQHVRVFAGPVEGDALMAILGERLSAAIDPMCLATRVGPSECAAALIAPDQPTALNLVPALVEAVEQPVHLGDAEVTPRLSWGISSGPLSAFTGVWECLSSADEHHLQTWARGLWPALSDADQLTSRQ